MNGPASVIRPGTLEEVFQHLNSAAGEYAVCAGGTDLFAAAQAGRRNLQKTSLVFIGLLPELCRIHMEGENLHIGAGCTFSQLMESALVAGHAPLLAAAASRVASPQIRNMATVGGNVCNASPAADGLTALVCLRAGAKLGRMENGVVVSRVLPVEDLILGPGKTALMPKELLTGFVLPSTQSCAFVFEKVGLRSSMAIAVVSLALLADSRGGVRGAFGSLGPRIVTSGRAEALAAEGRLDDAIQCWLKAMAPIDDLRASAEYRRLAAGRLLRRHLYAICGKEGT